MQTAPGLDLKVNDVLEEALDICKGLVNQFWSYFIWDIVYGNCFKPNHGKKIILLLYSCKKFLAKNICY